MADAGLIDWTGEESHLLLNPRMPAEDRRQLGSYVSPLPGHLWLATSGTTGSLKLTALSKRAMLASAQSVNRHLQATAGDVWYCVLPTFHVGGLGIYARAFLSGSRVVHASWDPGAFASSEATLASLVPAQVSDLVEAGLRPHPALRAIVVGGGALRADLYEAARALGWPTLPSYGMTETCSQVATATLGSPELLLLDHVQARTEADGRLAFRGSSLLTGYGSADGFVDPKQDGWFVTEDIGTVDGGRLTIAGRRGDFIKIGGESVSLVRLDAILAALAGSGAALVGVPDGRLGAVIHLATEPGIDAAALTAAFNEQVHPFERIRETHQVSHIPRTELGKLLRTRLLELVSRRTA